MTIWQQLIIFLIRIAYSFARFYWYLFRPRTRGAAVFIFNQNRLLLIKTTYRSLWEVPGGAIKRGESIPQAALREATEETGLRHFSGLKFLATITSTQEYRIDQTETYLVQSSDDSLVLDPIEIKQASWFNLENLPPDLSDHVRQSLNFVNINHAR